MRILKGLDFIERASVHYKGVKLAGVVLAISTGAQAGMPVPLKPTPFYGAQAGMHPTGVNLCYWSLAESRADFDVFVGETGQDGAAFGADGGGYDHAVGFDAAEFAGGQIDDYGDLAAD